MDNVVSILPEECVNMQHRVRQFCLPVKKLCDYTVLEGLFVECGKQWNCNKECMTEKPYFIPVPADGKFMLQTNFRRQNNSSGWGSWINIKLLDWTGEEVGGSSHTTVASRWVAGRSNKLSFQTIEIDVSKIDLDCFAFKITAQDQEICTQFYRKEDCHKLVEIEGLYPRYDCWNNYYGIPIGEYSGQSFAYSNKIYLKGNSKYFGGKPDIETGLITEYLRVYSGEIIAPFMMKYLINKVLGSKKVKIDGETWSNNGSGSFQPINGSKMFFPVLEFENECIPSDSRQCN